MMNPNTSHGRQFTLRLVSGADQFLCIITEASFQNTKYIEDQNKY